MTNPYRSPAIAMIDRAASSPNQRPPFLTLVRVSVTRTWLTLSVSSFVVTCACSLWLDDGFADLFRSDNPYIPGFIAAVFAAFFSLCGSVAGWLRSSKATQCWAYCVTLATVVCLLLGLDLVFLDAEGHGIPTILAAAIGGGGLVAYPVQLMQLHRKSVVWASVPGLVWLLGYCFALRAIQWT